MQIAIRKTTHADIDETQRFIKGSWARTYDPIIGVEERMKISDKRHLPTLFAREIESESGTSFIALLKDGTVIGHAGGEMRPSGECFIDRLHVDPQWQGKDIARQLLDVVKTDLAGKTDRIELTVLVNNERAIGFYKKYGFVFVGEPSVEAGLGGVAAVRMRCMMGEKA